MCVRCVEASSVATPPAHPRQSCVCPPRGVASHKAGVSEGTVANQGRNQGLNSLGSTGSSHGQLGDSGLHPGSNAEATSLPWAELLLLLQHLSRQRVGVGERCPCCQLLRPLYKDRGSGCLSSDSETSHCSVHPEPVALPHLLLLSTLFLIPYSFPSLLPLVLVSGQEPPQPAPTLLPWFYSNIQTYPLSQKPIFDTKCQSS